MKKILFILMLILSLKGSGQGRFSYELILDVSGVSNYSPSKNVSKPGTSFIIDTSGMLVVIPTTDINKTDYKSKIMGGITVGGRLNYCVYKKLGIAIGGSVSYFKVSRIFNNVISSTSILTDTVYGVNGTILPGIYGHSFASGRKEVFKFVTFNLPINIFITKAKWRFETGIIPSFIISSTKKKGSPYYDPSEIEYAGDPLFENSKNFVIGFSISPNYQVTKKIRLGIEYIHGVSSLIEADNYGKLLPRSFSLKILYKL